MSRKREPQFTQIEAHWYKKLKDEGFEDIENVKDKDRPLVEWHSFKFTSESTQIRKIKRSPYQMQIDLFANHPDLNQILTLIVKHGNSLFDEVGVRQIWDMHRIGVTERQIAKEMHCSHSCIHFMLRRIRDWMKIS